MALYFDFEQLRYFDKPVRTEYRITMANGDRITGTTTLGEDEVEALVKSVPIDVVLLEIRQAPK